MKQVLRKIIVLSLVAVLIAGLMPNLKSVSAASAPKKPKITVSLSDDGATVLVNISKTKRAEGYEISAKGSKDKKYTVLKTVELSGKKKQTVSIDNLASDKYTIKVRAYKNSNGSQVWGKYSKTKKVTVENNSNTDNSGFKKGDIVTFGAIDQNKDETEEPIEWIVLSNDDNKLFLVSVYALERGIMDERAFGDGDDEYDEDFDEDFVLNTGILLDDYIQDEYDGSWKYSQIRKHLNTEFLSKAFNEDELLYIASTELKDAKCTDKVFLLSLDEVNDPELGFVDDKDRCCAPASDKLGIFTYGGEAEYGRVFAANEGKYSCYWWLRTPTNGEGSDFFFNIVTRFGTIDYNECWADDFPTFAGFDEDHDWENDGLDDDYDYDIEFIYYNSDRAFGIRPAIKVELKDGLENVLKKTGKTMQEEWADAGCIGGTTDYVYDEDDWRL